MLSRIFENLAGTILAALLVPVVLFTFSAWREREPGPFVYLGRAHFDAKAAPESAFEMSTPKNPVVTDQVHADVITFKNMSTETIKDYRININLLDSRNNLSGEDVFRAWHGINDRGGNTIVKFKNDGSETLYEDLKRSDITSTGRIRVVFEKFGPGAKVDLFAYSKTHKNVGFTKVNEAAEIYDCCDDGSLPTFVTNNWLIASSIISVIIAALAIVRLFWINKHTSRIPKISAILQSNRKND